MSDDFGSILPLVEAATGYRHFVDLGPIWRNGSQRLQARNAEMLSLLRQSIVMESEGGPQLVSALSEVSNIGEAHAWIERASKWGEARGICLFEHALPKLSEQGTRFVHLQGIGRCPAILARELRPGYIISWNYAPDEYEVISVGRISTHYLSLKERNRKTGQVFTRRIKRDRLVAAKAPVSPPVV